MVQLSPGDILNVFCAFAGKAASSICEQTQIPGFQFPQVVQKTQLGEVGNKAIFDCIRPQ